MCLELTYESIIFIYSTLVWSRARALVSSCPLTEHSRGISVIFHYLRKNDMTGIIRFLTYDCIFIVVAILHHRDILPILLVSTHVCMSGMLACHYRCTRRRTHRATGIGLRKTHSFLSHTVNIRCIDIFLAITSQIAISHIVAQDKNDIRFLNFFSGLNLAYSASQYSCTNHYVLNHNTLNFEVKSLKSSYNFLSPVY